MNRTQKRRWNDLEVLRTKALLDAAQIAHEQARLASQEATEDSNGRKISLSAKRQQEAAENRAKIDAYLEDIPQGQPGRIREVKTALNLSANTVKKYVTSTPGYEVRNGLILRIKVSK
jgi:hypothetical protein